MSIAMRPTRAAAAILAAGAAQSPQAATPEVGGPWPGRAAVAIATLIVGVGLHYANN